MDLPLNSPHQKALRKRQRVTVTGWMLILQKFHVVQNVKRCQKHYVIMSIYATMLFHQMTKHHQKQRNRDDAARQMRNEKTCIRAQEIERTSFDRCLYRICAPFWQVICLLHDHGVLLEVLPRLEFHRYL